MAGRNTAARADRDVGEPRVQREQVREAHLDGMQGDGLELVCGRLQSRAQHPDRAVPIARRNVPASVAGAAGRIVPAAVRLGPTDRVAAARTWRARAVAAGAKQVVAVSDAHGWRIGRIVDPAGHHWEIARKLC